MDADEYKVLVDLISSEFQNFPVNCAATRNQRISIIRKARKFFIKDGELYRYIPGNINGAKVVVKENVQDILAEFHGSSFGGHTGINKTIDAIKSSTLRKMVNDHQTDWDQFIDGALFAQRTKPHSSTKYSPFFLLYGREAVYPSKLPKEFDYEIQPTEEEIQQYVDERQNNIRTTEEEVKENISAAQEKQRKDFYKRNKINQGNTKLKVNDKVLLHNSKKSMTQRKGNLEPHYHGPYIILELDGKKATLQNKRGQTLKTKINVDRLKLYISGDVNREEEKDSDVDKVQQEILQLVESGQLQNIIKQVKSVQTLGKEHGFNMQNLRKDCPVQSFIMEVSRELKDEVSCYATRLLPHIRCEDMTLSQKTEMTMIIASVCVKASALNCTAVVMAETLKNQPSHLEFSHVPEFVWKGGRLNVGGETIATDDLATLEQGKWLSDKIINSFLAILCKVNRGEDCRSYAIPSYTAVLWKQGRLDHWMFETVASSSYKYIFMPINVNGNHWILMVVNIQENTVSMLDSMHGDNRVWIDLWRKFMDTRKKHVQEQFGQWTLQKNASSKQADSSSCGIFALMNAESFMRNVPTATMRQVHCNMYREYVKKRLLAEQDN